MSLRGLGRTGIQKPTNFPEVDADSAAAGRGPRAHQPHPSIRSWPQAPWGQDEISRWCWTLSDAATTLDKALGKDPGARLPGKALTTTGFEASSWPSALDFPIYKAQSLPCALVPKGSWFSLSLLFPIEVSSTPQSRLPTALQPFHG